MLSRLSVLAIAALGASVLLSAPPAKAKRRPTPLPADDAFVRLLAQSEPGSSAARIELALRDRDPAFRLPSMLRQEVGGDPDPGPTGGGTSGSTSGDTSGTTSGSTTGGDPTDPDDPTDPWYPWPLPPDWPAPPTSPPPTYFPPDWPPANWPWGPGHPAPPGSGWPPNWPLPPGWSPPPPGSGWPPTPPFQPGGYPGWPPNWPVPPGWSPPPPGGGGVPWPPGAPLPPPPTAPPDPTPPGGDPPSNPPSDPPGGDPPPSGPPGNPPGGDPPSGDPPGGAPTVPTVHIVADTNRDGQIDASDDAGRDNDTASRGAIFNVNLDKDNNLSDLTLPGHSNDYTIKRNDGLSLQNDGSIPRYEDGTFPTEDLTINGPGDVPDITPFKVRITRASGNGWRYFIGTTQDCARAIHIFPSLAPDATRVLGGPKLWNDGHPLLEKEITAGFDAGGNLDRTFGLEGLAFRGMDLRQWNPFNKDDVHNERPWGSALNDPYTFSGQATIYVVARQYVNGAFVRQKMDTIRLRVAPFILRSNVTPSAKAWAINDTINQPLQSALGTTGQFSPIDYGVASGSQWLQDHCEIGTTYRPGQTPMNCVFELPYGARPFWAQSLLDSNTNVFQIGRALYFNDNDPSAPAKGDSGDYGGNVECIPPTPAHPLGQILLGDTCSPRLATFLGDQEVQPVVTLPTSWLEIGHVDEILQFVPNGATGRPRCVVANPENAYSRLDPDLASRFSLFTDGRNVKDRPSAWTGGIVVRGAVFSGQPYQNLQMQLQGQNVLLKDPQHPGDTGLRPKEFFIRFLTGSPGLTLRIDAIDFTTGTYNIDEGYKLATKVMDSTDNTSGVAAGYSQQNGEEKAMNSGKFSVELAKITPNDAFIVMDGMKYWAAPIGNQGFEYTPAGISTNEVFADEDLRAYNFAVTLKLLEVFEIIDTATDGKTDFIAVPTLFMGHLGDDFDSGRSGVAFTPGLANLQAVGTKIIAPDPLAPPEFTAGLSDLLPGLSLVDDWDLYHRKQGEVHCGTNVLRPGPLPVDWWTQLP